MRRLGVLALVLAAGCGGDEQRKIEAGPKPQLDSRVPDAEVRVIRGWITARNRHDFPAAAAFFAPGAIVDQGRPLVLPTRAAAIVWNSGLPCDADLTVVRRIGGRPIATFRLREGPGGPCDGEAVVRFTIIKGKIARFDQLPTEREPSPGEVEA
jgi:hypothetical protein